MDAAISARDAAIAASLAEIASDDVLRRELNEGRPDGNPITLGPRLPTAADWAEEQVKGATAKGSKWLKNTTNPKKNFKTEALKPEAQERYKNSMQKVLAEDRHAGGMRLVDEDEAMKIIAAGGEGPYISGVTRRKAKIQRVVEELHSSRLALTQVIDKMDTSTDEAREAKMVANKRGLQAIGTKRRGG
jgi:hypothetical protein